AGEWNRLECVCAGDTLAVILNGEVVNTATGLSHTRGRIALGSLGAEVFFRKLDLQPLPGFQKSLPPEEGPWTPLFNGNNLNGWITQDSKLENWGVANNVLFTNGKDRDGWLMLEREYTDFELHLEYRTFEKTNSGVALRTAPSKNPTKAGLEVQ